MSVSDWRVLTVEENTASIISSSSCLTQITLKRLFNKIINARHEENCKHGHKQRYRHKDIEIFHG